MSRPRHRAPLVVLLVALALMGAGGWLLTGAGGDATRRHVVVDEVPLDEVHPPATAAGERRPGVVVAHGFAGSAKLMAPFGDSLSARGYVVVLLDFSGHGANTRRLPDSAASTDASVAALQHDLDVATAHLRGLPDVDPTRIALVGHSMGASAVTRYAVAHPDITATVAISLPSASTVLPDRPSRLHLLVGELEFPDFHTEADRAAQGAPARTVVVVPRVEHISILFSPRTHDETAGWLDDSFDQPAGDLAMPSPVRRIQGAGLLLLSLLLGMYPLARLLLGDNRGRWSRLAGRQLGRTALIAVLAAGVAALAARYLPTNRLPLSVGGYMAGFTATTGAVMLAYQRWRPAAPRAANAPDSSPDAAPDAGPDAGPGRRRLMLATALLVAYAVATIAVPTQLGLTYAVPVGARWWLIPLVWAGFAVLSLAGERVAGGNTYGVLAVSAVVVIVLTAAASVGLTFGFVLLVVPLLAVLLLLQAGWSAVLNRFSAPPWTISLVGSLIVAWPIATTLPVIG